VAVPSLEILKADFFDQTAIIPKFRFQILLVILAARPTGRGLFSPGENP
jgi:hypothetical protein